MDLIQPERLAWLLLVPLLYLLSRPPRPRRALATAHLAQWLEAHRRLRRRPVRFRWWRFLLLLLAFGAVVLAHAGARQPGRPGITDLVIALDVSASMAAGDPSPWQRAVEEADRLLENAPDHVDVRLALCGPDVEVCRGTRRALRDRLAALQPAGPGGADLVALARGLASATTAVLTLTDGRAPLPEVGALGVFGVPLPNLAITACAVEDAWPLPELRLRVTVQNPGPVRRATLEITGAVEAVPARGLDLAADAAEAVEIELRRAAGGALRVALRPAGGPSDPLAADDAVDIAVPPPPAPRIAIRSEGPVHPALQAAADTLAAECGGTVVTGEVETAGFLLMDGGRLEAPPRGIRMLSFGTALGGDAGSRDGPQVLDWSRTDPVTAGLDLSELRVRAALRWPADLGTELIRGAQGPLAVVRTDGDAAQVHFAFRLADANLFKLAAFPQILRRSLARAYGRAAAPVVDPRALLDAAESDLRRAAPLTVRALPAFSEPPTRLAVPLLLLALLCLAIRAYV